MYFSRVFSLVFCGREKRLLAKNFITILSYHRLGYIPSIDRKHIRLNNTMNKKRAIHS